MRACVRECVRVYVCVCERPDCCCYLSWSDPGGHMNTQWTHIARSLRNVQRPVACCNNWIGTSNFMSLKLTSEEAYDYQKMNSNAQQ